MDLKGLPLDQDNVLCPLRRAVVNTGEDAFYGPVIDGIELQGTTEELAAKGRIAPVRAVMMGTTSDEGGFMMPLTNPVPGAPWTTQDELRTWMKSMWPGHVNEIMKLYSMEEFPSEDKYWALAAKAYTDQQYFCPTRRSARWLADSGVISDERIFVYEYTYEPKHYAFQRLFSNWRNWCLNISARRFLPCKAMAVDIGAGHASEVPLVWGGPPDTFNETDRLLSHKMISWWQQFAGMFAPKAVDGIMWHAFGHSNATMILQPSPVMAENPRSEICDFWDKTHTVPYSAAGHTLERVFPQDVTMV